MGFIRKLNVQPEARNCLIFMLFPVFHAQWLILFAHIAHKWLLVSLSTYGCSMLLKSRGSGLSW